MLTMNLTLLVIVCLSFAIINVRNLEIEDEDLKFAQSRASDIEFISLKLVHSSAPYKEIHFGYPGYPNVEKYLLEFKNGSQWTLNLQLNIELIPDNFKFHTTYIDNETYSTYVEHCYYRGYFDESEDSNAAISTCGGVLRGKILMDGESYILHHTPGKSHFLYNVKHEHVSGHRTCGTKDGTNFHEDSQTIPNEFTPINARIRRQSQISRFVELYIVIDSNLDARIGNIEASRQYAIEIANHMDTSYSTIQIRVAIVGVSVWQSNRIIVSGDLEVTLDNWLEYLPILRQQAAVGFDNAQLIIGLSHSSNVVGYAPVGSMCFDGSGGVNRDTSGDNAVSIASTVSHEMGHNFGMQHDQTRSCYNCPSENGCIMNAAGSGLPVVYFSTCSIDDLNANLDDGVGFCIHNRPNRLATDPFCGNGFVEEGEQCDCGSNDTCMSVDPCCEPGLCVLKDGASCSDGDCCVGCQFRDSSYLCRDNQNACDLREYCTGSDDLCPNNEYKRDGLVCSIDSQESYCYQGDCKVLSTQCDYLWGSTSNVGKIECFERLNIVGDEYGNCGVNSGNFVSCSPENVACGKIHCSDVAFDDFQFSGSLSLASQTFTTSSETITCTSATIYVGNDVPDPGLVFDGTFCGIEKICISQACVDLSSIDITMCPFVNSNECSGNGVCTNLATCRCDAGYSGSDCSTGSNGNKILSSLYVLISSILSLLLLVKILS